MPMTYDDVDDDEVQEDDVEDDDPEDDDVEEDEDTDDNAEGEVESDDVQKEEDEDDVDDFNVAEGDERIMLVVLVLRRMRWKLMMLRISGQGGGKCPTPGPTLCRSLRNRDALGQLRRSYRKSASAQNCDTDFAQACALEMHARNFARATLR